MIPRHKGSPRYRIAHGWKNEFGSFILESLKFLMHFKEPRSLLYLFLHILAFFFFSYIIFFLYTHFFLFSLSHQFFLFFFLINFFYLLPFEL
jgi:hypothetical protein